MALARSAKRIEFSPKTNFLERSDCRGRVPSGTRRWFDHVLVLQTENGILYNRLEQR